MTSNELNAISDIDQMISILKMAGWELHYQPEKPYNWRVTNPHTAEYEIGENVLDAWGDAWKQYVSETLGEIEGEEDDEIP